MVTTGGAYVENEFEWAPWIRTTAGVRADGSHYRKVTRHKLDNRNSGTSNAGLVSPKGTATFGPWDGTEFYVNGGFGFHSNDARGTTISYDTEGNPVERVTPLVRARGAEIGVRTVRVPHLQSTFSFWRLHLDSELVYNGDAKRPEPGPASQREGIEIANYYSPKPSARFRRRRLEIAGAITQSQTREDPIFRKPSTWWSRGAPTSTTSIARSRASGSAISAHDLTEDNSVQSKATTLLNLEGGYQLFKKVRVNLLIFNLTNEAVSDIDYYFTSRLPGEPLAGVEDIHTHPAVPRTLRVTLAVGF